MAAMVDCRSLIEFCRAYDLHRHRRIPSPPPSSSPKRSKSLNPLSHPICHQGPFAAIDAVILVLVLVALSVLSAPYFRLLLYQSLLLLDLLFEIIRLAPVPYFAALALTLIAAVAVFEIATHCSRRCGSPCCRGLRRSAEFDIQLESEECVRCLPPAPTAAALELGGDHKELEAELRKMAPLNGRTVLMFRAPCGCPAGRMEVWGAKKVRRIKK